MNYLPIMMIPLSLFDNRYKNQEDFYNFYEEIWDNGSWENNGNKVSYSIDGIEHSFVVMPSGMVEYRIDATTLWNENCIELADAYLENKEYENAIYNYKRAGADQNKIDEVYRQAAADGVNLH